MESIKSPNEIARQTLTQLVQRKWLATPENYQAVYNEIAGIKPLDKTAVLGKALEKILQESGKQNPKYLSVAKNILPLIEQNDFDGLENQLNKLFLVEANETKVEEINWSVVIRNLLKQLDINHRGITLSRKKEVLSKVLTNFSSNYDVLGQKIQALVHSWGTGDLECDPTIAPETSNTEGNTETLAEVSQDQPADNIAEQWRAMLLKTFDLVLIPHLQAAPEIQQKANILLSKMQEATTEESILKHVEEIKPILLAVETQRDAQQRVHETLLQLLRLIVTSMGEMAIDEEWLQGQTSVISDIISKPININMLYDAESSLKELIHKQSQVKPALTETKDTFKKMVTTYVDRLVDVTESTSDYHEKIESYQQRISTTEDIGELNALLNNILDDTRAIGINMQRTRDEFSDSQRLALESQKRILELTAELDHISEVAHEDYLTGALNRRGMDEALEREFSRADRHNTVLCIAMMDIDHFKKLNDNLGHTTGDQALTHFAKVIKSVLRPTDVLARYGGEEFIIIMPATPKDEAVTAVTRVQRELTKNFFMHMAERVIITFSAGVAERQPGEPPEDLIPRADAALYQAKHSGRNRVIAA